MAVISNAIANASENLRRLLGAYKVPDVKGATEQMVKTLGVISFKTQETIKDIMKVMKERFNSVRSTMNAMALGIMRLLGTIIIKLGPLALIMDTLMSAGEIIGAGIDSIKLQLPFVSDAEKDRIRERNRDRVETALTKTIENLQEKIDDNTKRLEEGNITRGVRNSLEKENIKNQKKIDKKQERLNEVENYHPNIKAKRDSLKKQLKEMKDRRNDGDLDSRSTNIRIDVLEKELEELPKKFKDVTPWEVTKTLSESMKTIGMAVAGFGAGKLATKGIRKAAQRKVTAGGGLQGGVFTRQNTAMMAGSAVMSMPQVAKTIGSYMDIQDKIQSSLSDATVDFGMTLEEWNKAFLDILTKKPAKGKSRKGIKTGNERYKPDGTSNEKYSVKSSVPTDPMNFPSNFKNILNKNLEGVEKRLSFWGKFKAKIKENQQFLNDMYRQGSQVVSNLFNLQEQKARRELERLKDTKDKELEMFRGTEQEKIALRKKHQEEINRLEAKQAKKNKKRSIAEATLGLAEGVARVWARYAANPIKAGILSGIVGAKFATQIALMKEQSFAMAGGGFIDGNGNVSQNPRGVSMGQDNVTGSLRRGEMVLNSKQQSRLLNIADGKGGGATSINMGNIVIEGNITEDKMNQLQEMENERLERLEYDLEKLQSFGRI